MALHPTNLCDGIALCAGAGGLELGLHIAVPGYRTVCFVERNAYAASALVARMADAALDDAPVWSDLVTFDGGRWRGCVDILTAGYPCQPFSAAGKRRGETDPRHLWPHVARVLGETGAGILFAENVEGHVSLGLERVRNDLCGMGYGFEAGVFSASEIGATHIRKRIFILAYADREHVRDLAARVREGFDAGLATGESPTVYPYSGKSLDDAVPYGDGAAPYLFPPFPTDFAAWDRHLSVSPDTQPAILRSADGLAFGMDRLHLAGNGVVPLEAADAFCTLIDQAASRG